MGTHEIHLFEMQIETNSIFQGMFHPVISFAYFFQTFHATTLKLISAYNCKDHALKMSFHPQIK